MKESEFYIRTLSVHAIEDLPFDHGSENVVLANPGNIALSLEHMTVPFDVGCWLYTSRQRFEDYRSKRDNPATPVCIQSFKKTRVKPILTLLESLFFSVRAGKLRPKTLHTNLKMFGYYLDWCDSLGAHDSLDSREQAKVSFQNYVDHLSHRRRSGDLRVNSAAAMQNAVLNLLSRMFEESADDLMSGMRLMALNSKAVVPTSLPKQQDVAIVVSFCKEIFNGLSDFLLSKSFYPFQLTLLNAKHWIFPSNKWMATPAQLATRSSWKRGFWAWNYNEGRLNTYEEIIHHFEHEQGSKVAKLSINQANILLKEANINHRHAARLNLAMWAHDAFVVLFFANTGMNSATIRDLTWADGFEIHKEHQGFRAIKHRAKGKLVEFYVAENFVRPFKKFLQLRSYILGTETFERLFFSLSDTLDASYKPIESQLVDHFTHKVKRKMDLDFPAISSRQWRAFKADYLIQKSDVATTAMMLQNSEITTLRAYSEGSESEVGRDISKYFQRLQTRIYESTQAAHSPSAAGHCSAPGNPQTELPNTPIESDCRQPEGCLFCLHHAIHADEVDIRKLVSMAYVIRSTRDLAASEAHYEDVFGNVLKRIQALLSAVASRSDALQRLVSIVEHDVAENENLDKYWESKLSNLIEIGAIQS